MTITRFTSRVGFIVATLVASMVFHGSAAVAAPVPRSIGQCSSGYFCIWSGTSYTGSFQQFSAANSYRPVTLSTVNSLYNHRSDRTYLHEVSDGSGSYSCYGPGAHVTNLSGWREHAKAVWLSAVTNC